MPLSAEALYLLGEVDPLAAARTAVRVLDVHVLLGRRLGLRHGGRRDLAVTLVAVQAVIVQVTRARLQLLPALFFS